MSGQPPSPDEVSMDVEDTMSEQSDDEHVIDPETLQQMADAGEIRIVQEKEGEAAPVDDDDDDDDGAAGEAGGEGPPEMAYALLEAHTQPVHCVAMSKTAPLIVSGGEDDTAFLWQFDPNAKPAAPLKPVRQLAKHGDTVYCAAFSSDGRYVATAGFDGKINMFLVEDGSLVATMEDLGDTILYMFWHPKGNVLFAGSNDSQSAMWNEKGVCLQYFTGHADEVTCGALVNDNKMLATGSKDFSVKVFAPKTGELVAHFDQRGKGMHELPAEPVSAIGPHPRVPDALVVGFEGGQVAFLSIGAKKVLSVVPAHESAVEAVAVSPILPYVATCCAGDGTLVVWNAETNNVTVRDRVKQSDDEGFTCLQFVGEHLYAADTQGVIRRYNARGVSTSPHKVFTGHTNTVQSMAVHEDGWIVSGGDDCTVRVFHPDAQPPAADPK